MTRVVHAAVGATPTTTTPRLDPRLMEILRHELEAIRFGRVTLRVEDGVVVAIDTEVQRRVDVR